MDENICLFDMDGTLADYDTALERDLNKIMSPFEKEQFDLGNFGVHGKDHPAWMSSRIDMIRSIPGWWLNLDKFRLGFEIFEDAHDWLHFDCHILTKGNKRIPNGWKEKVEWCNKFLPEDVKVTITQDKGMVYGKVLVDDYPDYIKMWLKWRPRGLVIMPAHKHNLNFYHRQVIRYTGKNREQVRKALEAAFSRKSGESLNYE